MIILQRTINLLQIFAIFILIYSHNFAPKLIIILKIMRKDKKHHEHSPKDTVDHLLLVFVILTFISGIVLDHAAESCMPSNYSFWLCTHIAIASVFTLLSLIHFKHHWGWFRTLPHKLKARKKDSLFLLLALIILLISGVCVTICKTHLSGFTHAITGFLCLIISIYHFYVRHVKGKRNRSLH